MYTLRNYRIILSEVTKENVVQILLSTARIKSLSPFSLHRTLKECGCGGIFTNMTTLHGGNPYFPHMVSTAWMRIQNMFRAERFLCKASSKTDPNLFEAFQSNR